MHQILRVSQKSFNAYLEKKSKVCSVNVCRMLVPITWRDAGVPMLVEHRLPATIAREDPWREQLRNNSSDSRTIHDFCEWVGIAYEACERI